MDTADYYNGAARRVGATFYRDCFGPNKRLLSRHYFNDNDDTVAILSCPTACFVITLNSKGYVAHIGKFEEKVNLE